MDREALKATFDQQAASYDQKWARLAAFRDSLHLLVGSIFSALPAESRVLCVGAGTGAEIFYLAQRFPGFSFTAVEPSAAMVAVSRGRAEQLGIAPRCSFHEGYLETLPQAAPFDAATCFLVSQFLLERAARIAFFAAIAARLRRGAVLASSDLSADVHADSYPGLLDVWLRTISGADATPEAVAQMTAAYQRDVAVLPEREVEALITAGGFEAPTQFLQNGLIHAWYSRRAAAAAGAGSA